MAKTIWQKIKQNHLLLMILCCLAIVGAVIILPRYFSIGALGYILLIFLCLVFHFFFMRKMCKKDGKHNDTKNIKL